MPSINDKATKKKGYILGALIKKNKKGFITSSLVNSFGEARVRYYPKPGKCVFDKT
jgi:hypothetical protein